MSGTPQPTSTVPTLEQVAASDPQLAAVITNAREMTSARRAEVVRVCNADPRMSATAREFTALLMQLADIAYGDA